MKKYLTICIYINSHPLTIKSRPYYQIFYLFSSVCVVGVSINLAMMFAVFIGLSSFISGCFRHLNNQFVELTTVVTSSDYRKKIEKFVTYHNQIMDYVDVMEDIVTNIIFGQLLVTGVILCGILFQLAMVRHIWSFIEFTN